jgi:hypothetical protein
MATHTFVLRRARAKSQTKMSGTDLFFNSNDLTSDDLFGIVSGGDELHQAPTQAFNIDDDVLYDRLDAFSGPFGVNDTSMTPPTSGPLPSVFAPMNELSVQQQLAQQQLQIQQIEQRELQRQLQLQQLQQQQQFMDSLRQQQQQQPTSATTIGITAATSMQVPRPSNAEIDASNVIPTIAGLRERQVWHADICCVTAFVIFSFNQSASWLFGRLGAMLSPSAILLEPTNAAQRSSWQRCECIETNSIARFCRIVVLRETSSLEIRRVFACDVGRAVGCTGNSRSGTCA